MKPTDHDCSLPVLAIDTSTPACSVALRIDGKIFGLSDNGPVKHGEKILAMVDECLHEAAIPPLALAAVLFAAGPGGFTGLRVGAAVAGALAVGAGIPVGGISSLALLAAGVAGRKEQKVLSLLDARMAQCYAGFYAVGATVRALDDDRLSDPRALPREWLKGADRAIGPGLVYRERFAAHTLELCPDVLPDARNLFRCLALAAWQSPWSPIDLRYLRDAVTQS